MDRDSRRAGGAGINSLLYAIIHRPPSKLSRLIGSWIGELRLLPPISLTLTHPPLLPCLVWFLVPACFPAPSSAVLLLPAPRPPHGGDLRRRRFLLLSDYSFPLNSNTGTSEVSQQWISVRTTSTINLLPTPTTSSVQTILSPAWGHSSSFHHSPRRSALRHPPISHTWIGTLLRC